MIKVGIVGSSGSIGQQALDVIRRNSDRFKVSFLAVNSSVDILIEQGKEFNPDVLVATDSSVKADGVLSGENALVETIEQSDADIFLVSAVGAAGILPALTACKSGKRLALANKESIVAAGRLILETAKKHGTEIIPVDSEHSAIYQCLNGNAVKDIDKVVLTASGGPFRNTPSDALDHVQLDEALKHPNWSMGSKITIDSATMMNKGLELIEARYLFDVLPDMLDAVIHPQSIVHSYVSYKDGSTISQMGYPDMRTPISLALGLPDRLECGVRRLDLTEIGTLTFYKPDFEKYGCLRIAMEVLKKDLNGPMIIMNAANEIAVDTFLSGSCAFLQIADIIEETLSELKVDCAVSLEEILKLDNEARKAAKSVADRMIK